MRSNDEIIKQIDGLKKDKKRNAEYPIFGQKLETYDAAISVLLGEKKFSDFYKEETVGSGANELLNAAIKADNWLKRFNDNDLFVYDLPLLKKNFK